MGFQEKWGEAQKSMGELKGLPIYCISFIILSSFFGLYCLFCLTYYENKNKKEMH